MGGTPLAIVSKLLVHSHIATTMRYAHLADAELAEATNGVPEILKPPVRYVQVVNSVSFLEL